MEIPATPGATGAMIGVATVSTPGAAYENMLTAAYEEQFGPIPSGLDFVTVNKAFQGPGLFGEMASVGVYAGLGNPGQQPFVMLDGREIAPPAPPPVPTEHTVYLDKVRQAGEEQRAANAAARRAEIETAQQKAWAVVDGLEINATGKGRIIDHDYGAWDLEIGGKGLIASLIDLDLDNLENEELGIVSVSIKFHGKDQP